MARQPQIIAGIAWFRSDQWELLRSLSADADDLEETHGEWIGNAEKLIRDLARQGVDVRKVDVDVNERNLEPNRSRRDKVRQGASCHQSDPPIGGDLTAGTTRPSDNGRLLKNRHLRRVDVGRFCEAAESVEKSPTHRVGLQRWQYQDAPDDLRESTLVLL